jgi:ribosomal protein S18 acetylase RimI-like enzyme
MISIVPLQQVLLDEVMKLSVADDQIPYVGHIDELIRASFTKPDETQWVICRNNFPVGFYILDAAYARNYSFCPEGSIGLRSFFVDVNHQGKGIAKKALDHILNTYDQCCSHDLRTAELYLTVNCRNTLAYELYIAVGFVDTKELYLGGAAGAQHIMKARGSAA